MSISKEKERFFKEEAKKSKNLEEISIEALNYIQGRQIDFQNVYNLDSPQNSALKIFGYA